MFRLRMIVSELTNMKKNPPAAGYHQYTLCLSQIIQLDLPIKSSWLISCLCVSCLRRINPSVNIQPVLVEDRSLNKIAQPHRVVNALHGWHFGHFQGFLMNNQIQLILLLPVSKVTLPPPREMQYTLLLTDLSEHGAKN